MFWPTPKLLGAAAVAASLALGVAACGDDAGGRAGTGAGRLQVEASFYPLDRSGDVFCWDPV